MSHTESSAAPSATPARLYAALNGYYFPSDAPEAARLRIQHNSLKQLYAPIDDENARVLDAGASEGSWVIEVATARQTLNVIGVDISSNLFSKAPSPNVSFETHSILELPAAFTGQFELVHQRLLMGAFTNALWEKAMAQLVAAVKPGGWIQLTEADTKDLNPDGLPAAKAMRQAFLAVAERRGLSINPTMIIRSLLEKHNFSNIVELRHRLPIGAWAGPLGINGRDVMTASSRGLMEPFFMVGVDGIVADRATYEKYLEESAKEYDENPGHYLEYVTFYAQKTA